MSQQLGSKVERQGKAKSQLHPGQLLFLFKERQGKARQKVNKSKSQLHPGTELYDKYTNGTVQSSKVSLVQGLNSSQGKKNVIKCD